MFGAQRQALFGANAAAAAARTARTIRPSTTITSILGGSYNEATAPTVSTSVKKYGTGSLSLANNSANAQFLWLDNTNNSNFSFTGDFTLEAWVYQTSNSGYRVVISNWDPGLFWAIVGGNQMVIYLNGSLIVNATSLTFTDSTWYHVAVSRSGSSVKLWQNGTQVGSTGTASGTITLSDFTGIGVNTNNYPTNNLGSFFAGYMDDIRISDIARYTTTFTAPTAALTNDANTLLLIHADGSNGQTTFTDDNA